jgi:thioesterase domain-containing protein/acyl carrier protein
VSIVSCDVTDRQQLASLVESVPEDRPLRGIVHTAAALDDGVVESWTPEGVDRVFAPKADAAWHLHELTEHLPLHAFILFSSAAGTFGNPGQGIYAAANVFLDTLAAYRRARGMAAVSLAWGLWAATSALSEAELQRLERSGATAMSTEEGLELFDAAVAMDTALAIPIRFDIAALRAGARAWTLPPLLRGLVRMPARPALEGGSLARRLAEASGAQHEELVLEAVCAEASAVLGRSPEEVSAQASFLELGFDSLTAVELRNRLNAATGLQLPVALVLDCPTPVALAGYLLSRLREKADAGRGSLAPVASDGTAKSSSEGGSDETISSLFVRAQSLGMADDFMGSLAAMSQFCATFDVKLGSDRAPKPIRLAQGPVLPRLICVPPILATSGPHQYIGFARSFRDDRDVLVLPNPGFVSGELLPASAALAIETQAEAARVCSDGDPFVLVGHSTGGMLAHAVAACLEGVGIMPAGVVLLDTYLLHSRIAADMQHAVMERMLDDKASDAYVNDTRLAAMATYLRLFAAWQAQRIAAPTLLVRAAQPMSGTPAGPAWQPTWDLPHTSVDVPGDHFTMLGEHAHSTGQAVHDWLVAQFE